MTKDITLLDCTLRDGGYYNSWDFSADLVEKYFRAAEAAGIDVIELGFRFFPQNVFLGPFAYTTDEFLRGLALPTRAKLGVMINGADLIKHPDGPERAVDLLFDKAENSPVSLVRAACHFQGIEAIRPAMDRLKALGYETGLNIMQVNRADESTLKSIAADVTSWNNLDVLYFADSLGNMQNQHVQACLSALSSEWPGPIGIHAHDNMGQGLANTLYALEHGATWADATMLGMGRGAGNAKMEFLSCEMGRRGHDEYNSDQLVSLIMEDFQSLQRNHGWGANLLYYMAARDDIHPTYVQTFYTDLKYDLPHIMGALGALKDMEGHSFSAEGMEQAIKGRTTDGSGAWSAADWLKGRDVLLLGAGPGAIKHRDALVAYIKRANPAVLSLNTSPLVPEELVTAFLACHPNRILMEVDDYAGLSRPIVIPAGTLHEFAQAKLPDINHLDYGMNVQTNAFEVRENGCTIPAIVVAAYGLALATSAGASRILLAGFDGFETDNARQTEMIGVFETYQKMPGALPLLAMTPTNYSVPVSSVYATSL